MATYFWVGGTGTWDNANTANWSATSGGAGGAGVPNNADIVNFDANSGTGTCTTAATAAASQIILNTTNLALTLGANLTIGSTFTFTTGTVNLASYVFTINVMGSNNTNTRVINFGTGRIDVTGSGTTVWLMGTMAGFSYTGTPTVNFTYSGGVGTRTLRIGSTSGATESNSFNVNITAGTDIINFGVVCKNCSFTGFSGSVTNAGVSTFYGNLTISSGMTWSAATTALSFVATSGTQQVTTNGKTLDCPITQNGVGGTVQLQDNLTMGSTRTFTLTAGTLDLSSGNRTLSTGIFNTNNANVRSIAWGTGNITITGNATIVLNITDATNLSYTGTPTYNFTYSGATGTRTIRNGLFGTSGSQAIAANLNISAGTDATSITGHWSNINFTGYSGASNFTLGCYGNFTMSPTMTSVAGVGVLTLASTSGTQLFTSNGVTINRPITMNGVGGAVAFQDALTLDSASALTLTNGTIRLKNGVTSTVGNFVTSGANQKFLQSTTPGSQATLSDATGTIDVSNLTIRDINATGGATWNAYVNQQNIDAGNNDGWDFGISPIVGSYEYTYQLRSFTQPRRF